MVLEKIERLQEVVKSELRERKRWWSSVRLPASQVRVDCVFPGHGFVLENWGEAVKEGKNVWREVLRDLQGYDWELDLEDFKMELVV